MPKAAKPVSDIDRLIELASDDAPASRQVIDMPSGSNHSLQQSPSPQLLADPSPSSEERKSPSMWRVLLQLRVLLPHLARLLPLLERVVLGTSAVRAASSLDTSRFDQGLQGIEASHEDLSLQLKNQAAEIKFLNEQLTWLGKTVEKDGRKQEQIAEGVEILKKSVRAWGIAIVILLVIVIGAIGSLVLNRYL
jgi:hypothetical protein